MPVQTDAPSIMQRLKTDTTGLHAAAEQTTFQQAMVAGRLPLDHYVASLQQMLLIHRTLEHHLRLHRELPAIAAVLRDYQFQEPYLLNDLQYFECIVDQIQPLHATSDLIAAIEVTAAANPVALLGLHYVLEGSKNGGKFLAAAARRAYNLEGDAGLRYLDPYGANQRTYWQDFRTSMEGAQLSPRDTVAVLDAAALMFTAITRLYRELYPS